MKLLLENWRRFLKEEEKRLLLEEVDRMVEQEVELFRRVLREKCEARGILLTEEQEESAIDLYRQQSRRDFLKKLGKWGAGAAAMGAMGSPVLRAMDIDREERAARLSQRKQEIADYKESDKYIMDELTTDITNPILYSWTWNPETGSLQSADDTEGKVSQPENFPLLLDNKHGTIGILSPEYGVVRKLYDDLKSQMGPDLEKKSTDLTPSVTKVVPGEGTAAEWKRTFPEMYGLPRKPNFQNRDANVGIMKKAFKAGFRGDVPVSPHYDGMIYLPYEEILPEMIMPNSGQTPSEYYVSLWEKFVIKRAKK